MFDFNEELFLEASKKIGDSLSSLSLKEDYIKELDSLSYDFDYKNEIKEIIGCFNNAYNELKILENNVNKTTSLINIINTKGVNGIELPSPFLSDKLSEDNFVLYSNINVTKTPFDSDNNGRFGSDQRSAYLLYYKYLLDPDSLTEEEMNIIETIKRLFKEKENIDDDNLIDLILYCSLHNGCGYAALTNVICDYYSKDANGDALFYEKYGYHLYTFDGEKYNYNFECLFVDLFLSNNDFNKLITYDKIVKFFESDEEYKKEREMWRYLKTSDYYNAFYYLDWQYSLLTGINDVKVNKIDDYLINYMGSNENISYDTFQGDISVETYKEKIGKYDNAVIAVYDFELKPYGNNPESDNISSEFGHWMTVTGVSENGNLIVSSWGYEYELIDGTANGGITNRGGLVFFKVGDENGN